MLHEKIQEIEAELENSNCRETDILLNEIETLRHVLGHPSDLKYDDKIRDVEIVEANNKLQQAIV